MFKIGDSFANLHIAMPVNWTISPAVPAGTSILADAVTYIYVFDFSFDLAAVFAAKSNLISLFDGTALDFTNSIFTLKTVARQEPRQAFGKVYLSRHRGQGCVR